MHISHDHTISQRKITFKVKEMPWFQGSELAIALQLPGVSGGFFLLRLTPFPLSPFVSTSKLCSPVKHLLWQETSWISCPGRSSWWRISRRSAVRTWETSPPLLMVRDNLGGVLLKMVCLGMCACWKERCAEVTITGGDAIIVSANSWTTSRCSSHHSRSGTLFCLQLWYPKPSNWEEKGLPILLVVQNMDRGPPPLWRSGDAATSEEPNSSSTSLSSFPRKGRICLITITGIIQLLEHFINFILSSLWRII